MRTFTPDSWAKVAGIPLARAIVFTEDLVEMGLAEHVSDNVHALTPRGVRVLDALHQLPVHEEAA